MDFETGVGGVDDAIEVVEFLPTGPDKGIPAVRAPNRETVCATLDVSHADKVRSTSTERQANGKGNDRDVGR